MQKRIAFGIFGGVFVAVVATWWFAFREVDGGGTRSQEIEAYQKDDEAVE